MEFVFVTGCQRSGTTLVGQILGAHSDAVLIDENHGVYALVDSLLRESASRDKVLAGCLESARKMYVDSRRFAPSVALADHVTHIILKVPNATYDYEEFKSLTNDRFHFIHVVRDVRDVVCSMQSLIHIPMVENQLKLIMRKPDLSKRFADEVAKIEHASTPDHIRRALVWRIKTGLYREFVSNPLHGMSVRYEALVAAPEVWISRMIGHVGLDPKDQGPIQHESVMQGQGPGLTVRKRSIDQASLSRWKRQLDEEQEREIWSVSEDLMRELGYNRLEKQSTVSLHIASEVLSRPIIATGRGGSGTRLLAMLLMEHDVFLGNHLNTSNDSLEWVDVIYEIAIRKLRSQLPGSEYLQAEIFARASYVLGRKPRGNLHHWGWKLPESLIVLPEIASALPHCKIIHLVRHPISTCLYRSHMTSRLDNPIGVETLRAAYRFLGWARDPQDDPNYIRNAASWSFQLASVLDQCRRLAPQRYLEVRFEDIIADPQRVSDRLADFLGKRPVVTSLQQSIDHRRAQGKSTDDELAPAVWSICKSVATSLGYEAQGEKLSR